MGLSQFLRFPGGMVDGMPCPSRKLFFNEKGETYETVGKLRFFVHR